MDQVAVFGIGSTNFRYAVATTSGKIRTQISVERTRPWQLADQLQDALGDLHERTASLDAVAVTAPGLVDREAGRIRRFDTPDGDTVDRIEVSAAVQEVYDLPVVVENDCTASALAEWHYGAGTGDDCVVHVTFGTGIGGGIVERGRIFRGDAGQAGEFGLIPVAPTSSHASMGVTGAWEAICSGRGIPAFTTGRLEQTEHTSRLTADGSFTAQDVFQAAADGDIVAQDCLDDVDRYNAAGIGAICNAVNPGGVTLGGGVALNNPERLLSGIENHLEDFLFVDRPALQLTPLGDDIGLYGALATAVDAQVVERASADRQSAEITND